MAAGGGAAVARSAAIARALSTAVWIGRGGRAEPPAPSAKRVRATVSWSGLRYENMFRSMGGVAIALGAPGRPSVGGAVVKCIMVVAGQKDWTRD